MTILVISLVEQVGIAGVTVYTKDPVERDESKSHLEDYIELEAEKKLVGVVRRFNGEAATYGKFMYHEDIDTSKNWKTDFGPLSSSSDAIWHHYYPELKDASGSDIRSRDTLRRSSKISRRGWVRFLGDRSCSLDMLGGGRARCSMIWRQFIWALRLHTDEEMAGDGFDGYWADSLRGIATKADLSGYWSRIDFDGDFLEMVPSYTSIRDPLSRLCHRLIALSISGRGQAPEKVTATDLFYLKSMDKGTSVNVLYLLAQYLIKHTEGRKHGARMYDGHFVRRLAEHFGLVIKEGLHGLTVVVEELRVIDMDELVAAVRAPEVVEGSLVVEEGAPAVPAPVPPPLGPQATTPTNRTMPKRMVRLEEEVYRLRESLGDQRVMLDAMSRNFYRLTT
ncbi:hypothetical protein Tco_0829435 [Tanacetum coccineum]